MNMRFWHVWLEFYDNECGEGEDHKFAFEHRSLGVREQIDVASFQPWGPLVGWKYDLPMNRRSTPPMTTLTPDGYLRGADEDVDLVAGAGL